MANESVSACIGRWNGLFPLNGIAMYQTKDFSNQRVSGRKVMKITRVGIDLAIWQRAEERCISLTQA